MILTVGAVARKLGASQWLPYWFTAGSYRENVIAQPSAQLWAGGRISGSGYCAGDRGIRKRPSPQDIELTRKLC